MYIAWLAELPYNAISNRVKKLQTDIGVVMFDFEDEFWKKMIIDDEEHSTKWYSYL